MAFETWMFVAVVVTGALWLWLHVALLGRILLDRDLSVALRLLAVLPPLTPYVAWRAGARTLTVLWAVSLLAYLGLRVSL